LNEKSLCLPVDRLVFALDYLEFLDRSWSQVRRNEWGFAELKADQNPRGFAADRARGIMRRFNLRWVPPMSQAFFAPRLHEALRSAVSQKASFMVPTDSLIEDLCDALCMCLANRPVLAESECGDRTAYSYKSALRSFFAAFACGELAVKDLR
jgi:hypothetical protein